MDDPRSGTRRSPAPSARLCAKELSGASQTLLAQDYISYPLDGALVGPGATHLFEAAHGLRASMHACGPSPISRRPGARPTRWDRRDGSGSRSRQASRWPTRRSPVSTRSRDCTGGCCRACRKPSSKPPRKAGCSDRRRERDGVRPAPARKRRAAALCGGVCSGVAGDAGRHRVVSVPHAAAGCRGAEPARGSQFALARPDALSGKAALAGHTAPASRGRGTGAALQAPFRPRSTAGAAAVVPSRVAEAVGATRQNSASVVGKIVEERFKLLREISGQPLDGVLAVVNDLYVQVARLASGPPGTVTPAPASGLDPGQRMPRRRSVRPSPYRVGSA